MAMKSKDNSRENDLNDASTFLERVVKYLWHLPIPDQCTKINSLFIPTNK